MLKSIKILGKLIVSIAALSLFISGCAGICSPDSMPEDDDPRVAAERTPDDNWTGKYLYFFCTKKY
jgi:hypothetical protein